MKRRVAILGATGIVGQRFISLLHNHPWFEIELLVSSDKSSGKIYGETVKWVIEHHLPSSIAELTLHPLNPELIIKEDIDVVFTALPTEVAMQIEAELAKYGIVVVSNSSNMRMEPDIPLIVPEINAEHIDIINYQQKKRAWEGFIVKIPNCTTIILSLSLKPLVDEFGVERVVASSMQAVSGAGLTGVPSVMILDNLIPYIEGEEEKVESESLKILGELSPGGIQLNRDLKVTTSCHRVPVLDGHTIAVFAELKEKPTIHDIIRALEEFRSNKIKNLRLPTAPAKPIVVRREPDRPQPRLDRLEGKGMSVVVGRLREDKALSGVKYVVLGHNTLRGAAGTGVLIAELLVAKNII
jgi:aspartate-semialdehyde dehydrogenase